MRKIKKFTMLLTIIAVIIASGLIVYAGNYTGYTSGSTRGKTKVTCTVGNSSGSSYSQAYFKLNTVNVVDNMAIKNINIVTSNGGGTMGAKKTGTMTDNIMYKGTYSPSVSIKSASATFSVNCSAFGTFTRNMTL